MSLLDNTSKLREILDEVNSLPESGGGGEWYDFTVTATSDISTLKDLLNMFTPYLQEIVPMKEYALIPMKNARDEYVADAGIPYVSCVYKHANGEFKGYSFRRRASGTIGTPVDMTGTSTVTVYAGDVFCVKVVRVVA